MSNFEYINLGIILLLIVVIVFKNNTISCLKSELENSIEEYNNLKKEHKFYYKLSEMLWNKYRSYDIFPSEFVRKIDEIGKWS